MASFTLELAIILILALSSMFESTPLSLITDKEALISFKSSVLVQPDQWPNPLSTWEHNLSPCNWTGVSCNKLGQRVVGLRLPDLGMSGSIAPHIGNLSFLRSLELQNNQLTGKLADQLANLHRLRMLNVSFNRLEGVIPSNLSQCRDLRVIDLTQNQLSGTIPEELTSNLMQLQVLNLAKNQLWGDIPSSLANISSLVTLNLGTNRLSGVIPGDLSRLSNLKVLDLTINNLSGTVPPSIYNSSSLVYLALASNKLYGDLPGDVGLTLPNLLGFNFCINNFTGNIPWSLQNLSNIEIIRMAHNRLHGTIPPGLGNLPKLRMYNIGFNNIVNSDREGLGFLELLSNSTHLDFLAFDSNLLYGEIPTSIGNLSKVLTKFFMGGNYIYGTIPSSIGDLRGLELLSLINNNVSGEIPQVIGQLKELRVLALAGNRLSGGIPDSFGDLQQLTEIDLSRNQLIGSIPSSFGNLQNLVSMDLSYNKLNGSIPKEIVSLTKLSIFLNLSDNQLTGTLPEQIGLLENTMEIIFSENKLSGNIPDSVGRCESLEKLVLARNTLSGLIPGSLGDIKGLITLDLSANQLSGEIPFELQKLLSLQLLNLSYNNLEGQVPTGGIFADPSKVHLEKNRNLCSDLSCRIRHGHRRRSNTIKYITISIAITVSLCFALSLLYFFRKGKGMSTEGSFGTLKGQHDMISYSKLRLATDDFNQENLIGRGSFGYVYKGILEGAAVAVKVLDTAMARSRKCFLAECTALRHLRHRNLVKLLTICSSLNSKNEDFLAMVFQFMSNGSLDDWIRGKRRHENGAGLSLLERLRCAIGIASAIDYMHNETEFPVVHCDLKTSNVLMDTDMTPKVADFGLAKLLLNENDQSASSFTHSLKGSIGYIPPEYGYGEKPTTAGDVYSFGILMLELFTGMSPTSEMFTGGLTLKSWVKSEFPAQLEKVLDADLLEDIWEVQEGEYCNGYELEKQNIPATVVIFEVALSCAADVPDLRVGIADALSKLKNVEKTLSQNGILDIVW